MFTWELDISGQTLALLPLQNGLLRAVSSGFDKMYPSRDMFAQFILFNSGTDWLAVWTEDSSGQVTRWRFADDNTKLRITFYGERKDVHTASFSGLPNTDDASWKTILDQTYKPWMLQQYWAKRKNPDLEKHNYFFTNSSTSNSYIENLLFPAHVGVPTPTACWLTQYRGAYQFDRNYPSYEWDAEGNVDWPAIASEYKARKCRLFPYINGVLWNSEHPDYDPLKMVQTVPGTPDLYTTAVYTGTGHPAEGETKTLYTICPSFADYHGQLIRNEFEKLRDAEGDLLPGVYLDVLLGTQPKICNATNHDHEPGDPYIWLRGCRTIASYFQDVMVMSEAPGEAILDLMDYRLCGDAAGANRRPVFTYLYNDIVRSVCWKLSESDMDASFFDSEIDVAKSYDFYLPGPFRTTVRDIDLTGSTDDAATGTGTWTVELWRKVCRWHGDSPTIHVRPAGSSYGTGVGDGYENALSGLDVFGHNGVAEGDTVFVYDQHDESVTVDIPANLVYVGGAEVLMVTYVTADNVTTTGGKFSQQMYVTSADRFVIYDAAFGSIEPAGQLDMVDADDARITGCLFNTSAGNNDTHAIDFEGPTDGGVIQTSVFVDGHVGIRVRSDFAGGSTTEQHANLTVRFNLFKDFTRGTASNADAVQFSGGASDDPAAGHTNVEVSDNRIRNCADNGIDLFGASGVSVLRNEVSDIAAGGDNVGVKLGQGTRANTDNYLIGNVVYDCGWIGVVGAPISGGVHQNTVAYCGSYGLSLATTGMPIGGASALYIYNNIVAYCDSGDADDACNNYNHTLVGRMGGNCYYQEDPSALVVRGSLGSYSTNNFATFRDVFEPTSIAANPQFVDAANRNFNLEPSSPCVRAGVKWWSSGEAQPHGQNGLRFPLSASGQPDMGAYPVRSDAGYARRAQALKVGVLDGGVDIVKARRI